MGDLVRGAETRRDEIGASGEDQSPELRLMFVRLGDDLYGIPMEHVDRLIPFAPVTSVPATPSHVMGVISLRGRILAVIDLREVLMLSPTEPTPKSRILVARCDNVEVGIVVDRVLRIASVRSNRLHEPLATLERFKREYVRGELPVDDGLLVVLDLPAVIRSSRQRERGESVQGDR